MSNFCEENQWQDAPFCGGPSEQGEATCDVSQRSARGYCPEESYGHQAELDAFSCDLGGVCDEGRICNKQGLVLDYETYTCVVESRPLEDVALPAAGVSGIEAIALGAAMLLAVGARMIRRAA